MLKSKTVNKNNEVGIGPITEKNRKVKPLELLREYFVIQQSIKRLEESADSIKASILRIPEKLWKVSKTGSLFLWCDDANKGVQLIQPESKRVLDRDRAAKYCVRQGLNDCVKQVLDEDKFEEACEEGRVPASVLDKLMGESSPGKSYIRSINKIPSQGENG